jgi:hypothetical protein
MEKEVWFEMIKEKEAMEWLKKGALLNFTTWGYNYPIYIELVSENKCDKISHRLLSKLRINKKLVLVKQERLSYLYKLSEENLNDPTKNNKGDDINV